MASTDSRVPLTDVAVRANEDGTQTVTFYTNVQAAARFE